MNFIKDASMDIVTLSNELSFVEAVLRFASAEFYEGKTPKILVTFEEMSTAYGCVSVGKIYTNSITGENHYMMKLNHIVARNASQGLRITSTIIHELIHIMNQERGIVDCSNGNRYHNGKFKSECDRIGLPNVHDPVYGTHTTGDLSPELSAKIAEFFKGEDESIAKLFTFQSRIITKVNPAPATPSGEDGEDGEDGEGGKSAPTIEKPKSHNLTAYICPKCGLKARAKMGANLICGDCNEHLIEAPKKAEK